MYNQLNLYVCENIQFVLSGESKTTAKRTGNQTIKKY